MKNLNYYRKAKPSKIILVFCILIWIYIIFVLDIFTTVKNGSDLSKIRRGSQGEYREEYFQKNVEFNHSIQEIERIISRVNKEQKIHNLRPAQSDDPNELDFLVVFVVQVSNRYHYVKIFLDSLKQIRWADTVLVIFSHSYYTEEINQLISQIKFCQYMQIYFPYSIQLYPSSFPGYALNDCRSDHNKYAGNPESCKCTMDSFNRCRDPEKSSHKHNFLWMMRTVFNNISVLKNYEKSILFLDDSNFLVSDILQSLFWVFKYSETDIAVLGFRGFFNNFGEEMASYGLLLNNLILNYVQTLQKGEFEVLEWNSHLNEGLAFNRTIWKKLEKLTTRYCEFDDWSWARSMKHALYKTKSKLTTAVLIAPRVLTIGDCDSFGTPEASCNSTIQLYTTLMLHASEKLFPGVYRQLNGTLKNLFPTITLNKAYGGWADPRDIRLCKTIAQL